MTELDFVSPDLARSEHGFEPVVRSPLERALRGAPPEIEDLSLLGKLEVRGAIGELDGHDVVPITRSRAVVVCDPSETAELRARLRERFVVFDVTAAFAGLRVSGDTLMRRLSDLDLDSLPAVGAVARVPAIVTRDSDTFRIFFPQEYADSVAEAVIDAAAGLQ